MPRNRRTVTSTMSRMDTMGTMAIMVGGVALVFAVSLAAAGCSAVGRQLPPRAAPPPAVEPVEVPPVPPPPPPPTQAELALGSAQTAARSGDYRTAIEQYQRAESLTIDGAPLADIRYSLALLHADPNNPERNLVEARAQLQRFLEASADRPGQREARAIAALIDDLTQVRAESATLKSDLDGLKAQVADLRAKLEEKEKELSGIKKVLLQNKNKP